MRTFVCHEELLRRGIALPNRDSYAGAAAPAARRGSGQWRRVGVLSVVPHGSSSEAAGSGRLRIDWNNRCALVRVGLLLNADADPKLSSRVVMSRSILAQKLP